MSERLERIKTKIDEARKQGKNEIELAVFRGEIHRLLQLGYLLEKRDNKTVIYFDSKLRDNE